MPRLEISLLGPFQVTLDGVPVTRFGAGTARALLAYLVMDVGTPHRRETLAGLLWPDQPESEARHNLSQALLRLRAAIGDRDTAPPFLLATRETIQFNPESDYWLDVSAFEEALTTSRRHGHRRVEDCAVCAERLLEAAALYGGAFFDGFSLDSALYEEWVVVERERLHRQAMEALRHLAAYHEAQGAYAEAVGYARRALALEPWWEARHRQVMRGLALGGDRSGALAQYEVCRATLTEELGVEPEEETRALYERIRDHPGTGFLPETRYLHNLPSLPTPTVGRKEVLGEIGALLGGADCRLLTLVGLGGIGKTRLAIEAARRRVSGYVDGTYFVALAGLSSASGIAPAIAQAVGLTLSERGDPARQLLGYLRGKEMLLVLDNYEHLLVDPHGPTAFVSQVLGMAAGVQVLVTSRERLNVQGEHVYAVQGMHYPQEDAGPEQVAAYSAVQLFVTSARRVRPGYEPTGGELAAAGRLCRMVGGVPLAIVLAAAWVEVLSPAEIATELGRSIAFLRSDKRDLPEEHHSMVAVFDASWGMLSEAERGAFPALSVFRGGCTREAAEAVAGADLEILRSLVRKSFLTRDENGRYQVHELLRQYGAQQLDRMPEDRQKTLDRHCTYYARWLGQWKGFFEGGELARVLPEIDNVRAGWSRAVRALRLAELRQYSDVPFLYECTGRFGEVEITLLWVTEVLREACEERLDPEATVTLAMALFALCRETRLAGNPTEAERLLQEARSLLRGAGAREELARTNMEVVYAGLAGYGVEARELLEESLAVFRESGRDTYVACELNNLAELALRGGDDRAAEGYCREALQVSEAIGNRRVIAWSLCGMGKIAYVRGQYELSVQYGERALALWRQVGYQRGIGFQCSLLGDAHYAAGAPVAAMEYYREAATVCTNMGWHWGRLLSGEYLGAVHSLCRLGDIHFSQGDVAEAKQYYDKALSAAVDRDPVALLYALVRQGELLARTGQLARAAALAVLIADHPESIPEAKERALALLAQAQRSLSPDEMVALQERGRSMPLRATVAELLEELRE